MEAETKDERIKKGLEQLLIAVIKTGDLYLLRMWSQCKAEADGLAKREEVHVYREYLKRTKEKEKE